MLATLFFGAVFAGKVTLELCTYSDAPNACTGTKSCSSSTVDGTCDGQKTGCVLGIEYTCSAVGGIVCFDSDAVVETPFGASTVGDVAYGDMVRDVDGSFTEVVGFIHRSMEEAEMLNIKTVSGSLRVSGSHVVMTENGYSQAKDLTVGMGLVTQDAVAEIVEISEYIAAGYVAPLTQSGTFMVDGFQVSCYANIYAPFHWLANLIMAPRRYLFKGMPMTGAMDSYSYMQKAFWALTPLASLAQ